MYAVIFRAKVALLDEQYTQLAEQLRKLALDKYGCVEFTAYKVQVVEVLREYGDLV